MANLDPETNLTLQKPLRELYRAVNSGNEMAIQQLLDASPSLVYAWDERLGDTPLEAAIHHERHEVVHLLLRNGADVRLKMGSLGRTPLHIAASHRFRTIMTILADYGADMEAQDDYGSTPLHLANEEARSKSDIEEGASTTKLLLERGADPNACDFEGCRPLHRVEYAAGSALFLLEYGADVNARDRNGRTPLHVAARRDVSVMTTLINLGADVHARDAAGWTPLHTAASLSTPEGEFVRCLLEAGADPNAQDNQLWTPFHVAGAQHCIREAEALVRGGADPRARDGEGKTPLYRAQHGPLIIKDDPEYTPRTAVSKIGRREMVNYLLMLRSH